MLTLTHPIELLQAATLRNNIVWLRSFGCNVVEAGCWVRIWHDVLTDYRALLLLPPTGQELAASSADQLRTAIERRIAIYIDSQVASTWGPLLEAQGYTLGPSSFVSAVDVHAESLRGDGLQIHEARRREIPAWSALYSRTFERKGTLCEADLSRWQRTAQTKEVTHFFFMRSAEPVGVCQVCDSNGLAGLYSVGFAPVARNRKLLRHAMSLVARKVAARGLEVLYFERSRPRATVIEAVLPLRPRGTRLLRAYRVWLAPR